MHQSRDNVENEKRNIQPKNEQEDRLLKSGEEPKNVASE